MPKWKLRIFVRAVKARMEAEQATVDEILETYPKLTQEEKAEIKAQVEKELKKQE